MVEVIASLAAQEAHRDLVAAADIAGVPWLAAEDAAMRSLSETVHPQGIVAVCHFVDQSLTTALYEAVRLVACCVDVRDPGNAGTIIRCADAAGADVVVLTGNSVDPYNGKSVRASAGSLFHLPLVVDAYPIDTITDLRAAGLRVLAADGAGEVDLHDAADSGLLDEPTAWVFGNEAHGLCDEVAASADHRIRIPLRGRAESLNLATAAAVCLFASVRAHRG